jgi:hypothetical protein
MDSVLAPLNLTNRNNDILKLPDPLFFAIHHKGKTLDLMSNGSSIPVTNDNKMDYIDFYWKFRLIESTRDKMHEIKSGLTRVVPEFRLNILGPTDLSIYYQISNSLS